MYENIFELFDKTSVLERLGDGIGNFALKKSMRSSVKKDLLFERGTKRVKSFSETS